MATCKGCGAEIFWEKTRSGKMTPVNADGTTHWSTCPKAKDFKDGYGFTLKISLSLSDKDLKNHINLLDPVDFGNRMNELITECDSSKGLIMLLKEGIDKGIFTNEMALFFMLEGLMSCILDVGKSIGKHYPEVMKELGL